MLGIKCNISKNSPNLSKNPRRSTWMNSFLCTSDHSVPFSWKSQWGSRWTGMLLFLGMNLRFFIPQLLLIEHWTSLHCCCVCKHFYLSKKWADFHFWSLCLSYNNSWTSVASSATWMHPWSELVYSVLLLEPPLQETPWLFSHRACKKKRKKIITYTCICMVLPSEISNIITINLAFVVIFE